MFQGCLSHPPPIFNSVFGDLLGTYYLCTKNGCVPKASRIHPEAESRAKKKMKGY